MRPTRDTRQLNWLLAWAVVFCDIGTSVYYVPGILYGSVSDKPPFFVLLTAFGFILLALKYIEITWRNPEGGGVVTITTKAFGPMWGCLGGMLITTSYFLTAAISAGQEMSTRSMLVGFGAAWLAFSGLESISQISPAMRFPLRRTTRLAMAAVIVTMVLTSPLLTALSVAVLPPEIK